jgi:hypothetical protein
VIHIGNGGKFTQAEPLRYSASFKVISEGNKYSMVIPVGDPARCRKTVKIL